LVWAIGRRPRQSNAGIEVPADGSIETNQSALFNQFDTTVLEAPFGCGIVCNRLGFYITLGGQAVGGDTLAD